MPDKKVLNKIIEVILQVVTPDKIILFGSQARGDAREDSDYDILVVKSDIDERNLAKKIYRKLVDVDACVDVIVKTPENLEKSKNNLGSIIRYVLKEGIVIYG
ncbi:MAG: nucleotidyltransferase domain-containing protein [bacterium]